MEPQNPWNAGNLPNSQVKTGDTSRNLGDPEFEPSAAEDASLPLAGGTVQDRCPCCTADLDVSGIAPLTVIACPSCRQEFRVLEQFAGYALSDHLGSGTSGMVYLATKPLSGQT